MSEGQSFGDAQRPVLLEYDIAGRKFELYVNSTDAAADGAYIFQEVVLNNEYLRHGIELHPGAVVIDIGAHIGCFGIKALTAVPYGDITYIGVEPCPLTFRTLNHNLQGPQGDGLAESFFHLNPDHAGPIEAEKETSNSARKCARYPGNIKLFQAAICEQSGQEIITYYPYMPSNSTFKPTEKQQLQSGVTPAHYFCEAQDVLVPVTTLGQLLQLADMTGHAVDLLKIDVESHELEVLRGLSARTWELVQHMVVEVHDVCADRPVAAGTSVSCVAAHAAATSSATVISESRGLLGSRGSVVCSDAPPQSASGGTNAAVIFQNDVIPEVDGRVSQVALLLKAQGFQVVVDCPMGMASNFTLFARKTRKSLRAPPSGGQG